MANWGYVAIDKTGKEIKGNRDADTQEALTRDLKQQGLIVLEVKQQNTLTPVSYTHLDVYKRQTMEN